MSIEVCGVPILAVGALCDMWISDGHRSTKKGTLVSLVSHKMTNGKAHPHELVTDVADDTILPRLDWYPRIAHTEITNHFSSGADFQASLTVFLEQLRCQPSSPRGGLV